MPYRKSIIYFGIDHNFLVYFFFLGQRCNIPTKNKEKRLFIVFTHFHIHILYAWGVISLRSYILDDILKVKIQMKKKTKLCLYYAHWNRIPCALLNLYSMIWQVAMLPSLFDYHYNELLFLFTRIECKKIRNSS